MLASQKTTINMTKIDCEMMLYHYISNGEIPRYEGLQKRFLFHYCKDDTEKSSLLYIYYMYFMNIQSEMSIFRKIFFLRDAVEDNQSIEFLIDVFRNNYVSVTYIEWLERFLEHKKMSERDETIQKISE